MAELFLDVNIPMYAAGREHPYRESCAWVMTEIAEGRIAAAIDAEIIQEVLYRYSAIHQWRVGVSLAENLLEIVPKVYPIQLADIRLAVRLFEQYAPKCPQGHSCQRCAARGSDAQQRAEPDHLHRHPFGRDQRDPAS